MKNFLKGIAAKLRNRKTDDIKIGAIAEVIDPRCCHFNYGEIVMLKSIDAEDKNCPYYFMNNHGLGQYLRRDEFRVAGETAKPVTRAKLLTPLALVLIFAVGLIVGSGMVELWQCALAVAGLAGLLAFTLAMYVVLFDPSTKEFCKSVDNANSLTENEDEWLGM